MKPSEIAAHWPLNQHPFSLGNLLILRQELEILAKLNHADKVTLFFTDKIDFTPNYLNKAFLSQIHFELQFVNSLPPHIDWPPRIPSILMWPYSSFRRIHLLSQINRIFPSLLWPLNIQETAKEIINSFRRKNTFAVHLKNQGKGAEESDATFANWNLLFEKFPETTFILLGSDPLPDNFPLRPNMQTASALKLDLPVQLAISSLCDGFMGMASGISAGAFFSHVPYVTFKHPSHHAQDMEIEIGSSDCLPFAKPHQKIWRKIDSVENLFSAFEQVTHWIGK